jgi:hypothetical protein
MAMLIALADASCANGRNASSGGGASGVASSTLGSSATPTNPAMTSKSASNDRDGNGGSSNGGGASGGAPIAVGAAAVQASLPEELLRSILGCWRLGDQEQWMITRAKEGGVRVVRHLLAVSAGDTDYARRAAIPSNVSYDPGSGTLVFSTAGPQHALRFVFSAGPAGLTGNWASSHAPGSGYHLTGGGVTLRPCGVASK